MFFNIFYASETYQDGAIIGTLGDYYDDDGLGLTYTYIHLGDVSNSPVFLHGNGELVFEGFSNITLDPSTWSAGMSYAFDVEVEIRDIEGNVFDEGIIEVDIFITADGEIPSIDVEQSLETPDLWNSVDIDDFDDESDMFTFALTGADANYFNIDSKTGDFWYLGPEDIDVFNYDIYVEVFENGETFPSKVPSLPGQVASDDAVDLFHKIRDYQINFDIPVFIESDSWVTVAEDIDISDSIWTADVSGGNGDYTYDIISSSRDSAEFEIDNSGNLSFLSSSVVDYEMQNIYHVAISVTSGSSEDIKLVEIHVEDVAEGPMLVNPIEDQYVWDDIPDFWMFEILELDFSAMGSVAPHEVVFSDPEMIHLSYAISVSSDSTEIDLSSFVINGNVIEGDIPDVTVDTEVEILVIASDGENYAVDFFTLLIGDLPEIM